MENQTTVKRTRAKKATTAPAKAESKAIQTPETPEIPFYDKELDPMPEQMQTPAPAPMFTLEQVQKMIEEAVSKKLAETAPVNNNKVAYPTAEETVTLRFQDEVNDTNVINLGANGKFGQITGKKATIVIPKRDFFGEFRTALVQALLRNRTLLVVDGLTDEERERHGVLYNRGEYLEEGYYEALTQMGDEIVDIFRRLHPTWRHMVALRCMEAYDHGKLKISRKALVQMNKISKEEFSKSDALDPRRKGAFRELLDRMNVDEEA